MFKLGCTLTATVVFVLCSICAAAVLAQPPQKFVSARQGRDFNPCTVNLPCRTFAATMAQVPPRGVIIALDAGDYGPVTINKSVTIAGPVGGNAEIRVGSGPAITIDAAASDIVVLRGLTINGSGLRGPLLIPEAPGVLFRTGEALHIENCVVNGFFGGGISFGGAGELFVKDLSGGHFMLKQLLVITGVLTCAAAQSPKGYVEYGDYDARKCLKATKSEGGNEQLDLKCVDEIMDDLAKRVKGYPSSFRSDKERKRAERDVRLLAAMFDPIVAKDDAELEMLLRAGFLNSMGHNLDIEGSAEKAINYFERLLKKEPDHVKGNYLYGIFLAATATKHKESVKYLEKAYRLGVVDAAYALGLVHLVLGDKRKSLEYLEAYAQNNPDDEKTKRLIEGIKSGRVEVKRR